MQKYVITITEILKRAISIEADTSEAAISAVESAYRAQKIVLDSEDYTGITELADETKRYKEIRDILPNLKDFTEGD